jgi:hypothetical protein
VEKRHFYLREAICQLEYAKRSYFEYEQAKSADDTLSVFYHLHHFIVHVINVDKLFSIKPGTSRESILKEAICSLGIDLKVIRKLRNHLEHFDERLDTWIQNHDGNTFFDNNIVTGAKGFPEKAFLRALDGDVYKFYGDSFSLVPIFEAIDKLHCQLIKLENK